MLWCSIYQKIWNTSTEIQNQDLSSILSLQSFTVVHNIQKMTFMKIIELKSILIIQSDFYNWC